MGSAIPKGDRGKTGPGGIWKLEDAKARFSEVVRRAQSDGPQRVTVRGREAVVVMSVAELDRLLPSDADKPGLVPFLESLGLDTLNLDPEIDGERDVAL